MRSLIHTFLLGTTATCLAACVMAHPGDPATGMDAAGNKAPSLPANYKKLAAQRVVHEYIRDASGPPEISDRNVTIAPLGASTSVTIRFPVSADVAFRRNIFAHMQEGTYYRCLNIYAHSSVSTLGDPDVRMSWEKIDRRECGKDGMKFSRFAELETMASAQKTCGMQCTGTETSPLGGIVIRQ